MGKKKANKQKTKQKHINIKTKKKATQKEEHKRDKTQKIRKIDTISIVKNDWKCKKCPESEYI